VRQARRRSRRRQAGVSTPATTPDEPNAAPVAPASDIRKSAIVTIRSRKHTKNADVEELTEEELQRGADAAGALWRELVRRATSQLP
jgi:hypothetical protein